MLLDRSEDPIQLGLPRQNNAWALRREQRTPHYTTHWRELLSVKL
ncbi:DUF4113 domain-containing protein [Halomonas vilamensis]|uniref:DUF4113 domain-containing protein n=1 Tax=Vreelandella vilamensis TaxID=531309 RepID=A0ABU1H8V1_9GAMM|nr:DUF4113 domain-containing protein [Halomonas vilamensis]MDR5900276.1 DUF4113 domain-containing protein [Halomonas vilamensis]